MRLLSYTILVACCLCSSAQTLEEVRKSFHEAVLDPQESRTFHDFLKDVDTNHNTIKAYQAVSEAMLARVVWNPFTKLAQVMKYEDLIEMAVEADTNNIEIRFLRLAIEYNLPRFLGMSKHMEEDRDVIVANMSSIHTMNLDPSFARYIIYFLNDTGLCSDKQIAAMKAGLESVGE